MDDEQELNRKRKISHDYQIPRGKFPELEEGEDKDFLALSLAFQPNQPPRLSPFRQATPPPPPLPPPAHPPPPPPLQALLSQPPPQPPLRLSPSHPVFMQPPLAPPPLSIPQPSPAAPMPYRQQSGPPRHVRTRRNPTQSPGEGKSEIIPAPYPWATSHRATVHSLKFLDLKKISIIKGDVQCKRCERNYEIEYNLREKFFEVGNFIVENRDAMHDRAPSAWINPVLPSCKFCQQENSVKPVISEKKKTINWLFLLLGQMLGCCTLEQLKYFCKHTKNHRTGAKDRVLYLTYLALCKQLDPTGPFDR